MIYVQNIAQLKKILPTLENQTHVGFDTEGTSLLSHDNTLLILSFAYFTDNTIETVVIDCTKIPDAVKQCKSLLESKTVCKIGHNLTYDSHVLLPFDVYLTNMHDTLLADQLLHAGLFMEGGFSLKAVAKRRLGIELDKEVRDTFIYYVAGTIFTEEQLTYAAHDARIVLELYALQIQDIEQAKLTRVYAVEVAQIPISASMRHTGIYVDGDELASYKPQFERFMYQAEQALQELVIDMGLIETIRFDRDGLFAFNNSSPQQVKEIYAKANINPASFNAKDVVKWDMQHSKQRAKEWQVDYYQLIADEEVAEALTLYEGLNNPLLRAHAFVTGANKLYGTYIEGLLAVIHKKTKRVHANFNILGASKTGRFSGNKPNFQNMPNDHRLKRLGLGACSIRSTIKAAAGRSLLIADYSGIELVILAVNSQDEKLLHEITQGDIHTYVARHVLGNKDITKENKGKEPFKTWRNGSKKLSYSIAYGTTGANLSQVLSIDMASVAYKIDQKKGDALIQQWFATFPKTAAYLQNNAVQAITKGYVADAWGRRRYWHLPDLEDKWKRLAAQREGMNAPIQGSSATMTKRAMQLTHERLDPKKARIVITIHDEIVVESMLGYVDTASAIMKASMEQALAEVLPAIADIVGKFESTSAFPKASSKYDK